MCILNASKPLIKVIHKHIKGSEPSARARDDYFDPFYPQLSNLFFQLIIAMLK